MASPFAAIKRFFRGDQRDQLALPDAPQTRQDGYANIVTGLSTAKDKRMAAFSHLEVVSDIDGRQLWRSDDMAKRVVEMLPREAMRRGYEIKAQDKETSEKIAAAAADLDLDGNVRRAAEYERAYGGAALLPVLDGPIGDWKLPLDRDRVNEVLAFHVLEPRELFPQNWYANLTDPKFGMPSTYRCIPMFAGGMMAPQTTTMVEIHESRLVIFPGIRVTRLPQPGTLLGWGDNVLTVMNNILRDFGQSWGMAANLLQSFGQAILQIEGLDQIAINDQGNVARDRLAQINLISSFMNAIVIDTKDKYSRIQTPMTGLPELLREMATRLAAAADMPVTLLMGMSPAGLNATGESDRDFWFDRVYGLQHRLTPIVTDMLDLIVRSKDGPTGGVEPDMWSIEWKPLDSPTEKEVADTRYVIAQTDDLNIKNQIYSGEDAAHSHYGGDTYSPDIVIDWDARVAQRKAEEDEEARAAAAALTNPNPTAGLPPGGAAALPAATDGSEDAVPKADAQPAQPAPLPPAKETRQDFDPDQPRDNDGKWGGGSGGSGGGSGGGGGSAADHAARARDSQDKARAASAAGDHAAAVSHLHDALAHAKLASSAARSELATKAGKKAPVTTQEKKTIAVAHAPGNLTPKETSLLHAMATTPKQRGSDSTVLKKAGVSQGEALTLSQSIRGKLAIGATDNLRSHAVALHKAGKLEKTASAPKVQPKSTFAPKAVTPVARAPVAPSSSSQSSHGAAEHMATAHAEVASEHAGAASAHAMATGEKSDHAAAGEAHRSAEGAHKEAGNESKAGAHGAAAEHHEKEADHGKGEHEHGKEGHEGKEHGAEHAEKGEFKETVKSLGELGKAGAEVVGGEGAERAVGIGGGEGGGEE